MLLLSAAVVGDGSSDEEHIPPVYTNNGEWLSSDNPSTLTSLRSVQPLRAASLHVNNTAPLPMRRFIRTSSGRLTVLEMEVVPNSFDPRVFRELEGEDVDSDETILLDYEESNSADEAVTTGPSTANGEIIATGPSTASGEIVAAGPSTASGEIVASTSSRTCPLCCPTGPVLSVRELFLRTLSHTVFLRPETKWQERAALTSLRESQGRLLDEVWQIGQIVNETVPEDTQLRYAPAGLESLLTTVGIVLDSAAERLDITGQSVRLRAPSATTSTPSSPEPEASRAECVICFGFPTRFLRPCGHVLCETCLLLVKRCPQCKRGISHSFRLFL